MKVAVIPARGGSKRIPRKNIRPFAGRPMIAHTIGCAQRSGLFDRIVVSTDDAEIADVARHWGAEVPFTRPADMAGDMAGTDVVIAHAVERLVAEGAALTAVCCLYATAPFMREEDIRRALTLHESRALDYVFAATTFAYPIFRAFEELPEGGLAMFYPDRYESRSQDLPEALHDAGQFYWGTSSAWLRRVPVFGKTSAVVRIPRWRVQDIDTEEDWARAEAMAAYLGSPAFTASHPDERAG